MAKATMTTTGTKSVEAVKTASVDPVVEEKKVSSVISSESMKETVKKGEYEEFPEYKNDSQFQADVNWSKLFRFVIRKLNNPDVAANDVANAIRDQYQKSSYIKEWLSNAGTVGSTFSIAKGKVSGASKPTKGYIKTLKEFAIAAQAIDAMSLSAAIELVVKCGGTEEAQEFAAKWAKLVAALDGNKAKAIEVLEVAG